MSTSALNPNAPIYVPPANRSVEEFSDQWWDLVQSSPWFRDHWLQLPFSDPKIDSPYLVIAGDGNKSTNDAPPKEKEEDRVHMDMVVLGWLKWRKHRGGAETPPRYCEKVPKIVHMRVKTRSIQQPR